MSNLDIHFGEFLAENRHHTGEPKVGPMDGTFAADGDDYAAYQLDEPIYLNRLNAWLGALSQRPYINPYVALGVLKNKLTLCGIDFENRGDFNIGFGANGTFSTPLKQWGKSSDWSLKIHWVVVKGLYTLDAELVKEKKSSSEINEKPILEKVEKGYFNYKNDSYRSGKASKQRGTGLADNLKKHGYALKTTLGDGSRVYTHTQGHALHIHTQGLHGATFSSYDPAGNIMGRGTSTAALRKHLATIHGRINDHKKSKGGFNNVS